MHVQDIQTVLTIIFIRKSKYCGMQIYNQSNRKSKCITCLRNVLKPQYYKLRPNFIKKIYVLQITLFHKLKHLFYKL